MIDTPVRTTAPAQDVAAVHLTIPLAVMATEFPRALTEIGTALQQQNIHPTGPIFAHHLRRPTDTFDFYVCLPVERPVLPAGRVEPLHLPAVPVIRTTYHGDYSGLPHAWPDFMATPQVQASRLRGDFYETYVVGPTQNAPREDWRTDLSIILADDAANEKGESA